MAGRLRTIDLCLSLFSWALFRSTKVAIKLHTLLDLRGAIPAFIHISDGKLHDVNVLDMLVFEAGAFYAMDRGYVDFERLYALQRAGVTWAQGLQSSGFSRRGQYQSSLSRCGMSIMTHHCCRDRAKPLDASSPCAAFEEARP